MGLREGKSKSSLEKAQEHVLFHHDETVDGYITLAKKDKQGYRQYHYKPEQLAIELSKWLGENVYFSQNTFYKPQRRVENIRQLRSLYIDIDCHNVGYEPWWVAKKIELELYNTEIPPPSLIIYSGRGLVPIWLIEPTPYQALPLWQAIQKYLFSKLEYVGADDKALDAARVFRVAGGVHSKNKKTVEVDYQSDYKYTLREIQHEYLPEIPHDWKERQQERKKKAKKKKGRKKKLHHLFNLYTLHHDRLLDLVKLVEMREYDVHGHREIILFLYRYWTCCFVSDPESALDNTIELNKQFKSPLIESEVIKATKSAEKAWEAKSSKEANEVAIKKGYPGAGYNLKNTTIIEWLKITEEEQKHLKTIIGRIEKNNRFREYRRKERSSVSREEYLQEQQEKTESKLWELQQTLKKHPEFNRTQIAKHIGVSRNHLYRLLKKI